MARDKKPQSGDSGKRHADRDGDTGRRGDDKDHSRKIDPKQYERGADDDD